MLCVAATASLAAVLPLADCSDGALVAVTEAGWLQRGCEWSPWSRYVLGMVVSIKRLLF